MFYRKLFCLFFLISFSWFICQISFANSMDPIEPAKSTINSIWAKVIKHDSKFALKGIRLVGNDVNYQTRNLYQGKGYYGRIISISDKILGYFPADEMATVVCWDNFDPKAKDRGGCKELSEGEMELRIPYFLEGKKVEFFDQKGKKILIIDISSVTR